MASQNLAYQTDNQLIMNQDVSKIFLGFTNRYQKDNELNNSTYDPLVLPAGTIMGRIHATGNLAPLNAAASDGSQFPVGILAHDVSIDAGETIKVTVCDFGDIAADKVVFLYSGQGLETVVSSRRMRDHLQAQGLKLITSTEHTGYDNQ